MAQPVSTEAPAFEHLTPPAEGVRIQKRPDGTLEVPDQPIIPFIEGDGTGPDIWRAAKLVFDAAVEKAYGGRRKIVWFEVFAGEKAYNQLGTWLPEDTLKAIDYYLVAIKGPLTTPVGGGIRSLNVALRQQLDLYACVRPVRYFPGVPSPVRQPELVDMVIFRENSEDVYAGIEFPAGSPEAQKLIRFLQEELGVTKIRFPETSGIGIKPISRDGTRRLVRAAIRYAIERGRKSVTLVHKGNIMKFTEGAFREWGYELAREEFGARPLDGGPWHVIEHDGREIVIKDVIADAFLQQILTRPAEYDVIATMNLNGDYISDALAAQVGGIGIAPGRQHQLRDRPRRLRGHPRHGAQVCRAGQGQPQLGDPLGRDDAPLHGLARGGRPDHPGHRAHDRAEARHLRLPPPHGRRHAAPDERVRAGHRGKYGLNRRRGGQNGPPRLILQHARSHHRTSGRRRPALCHSRPGRSGRRRPAGGFPPSVHSDPLGRAGRRLADRLPSGRSWRARRG